MSEVAIQQAAPLFSPAAIETAKEALVEACKATKSARRRTGNGPIEYVEVPDHAIRVVAAKIVVEFAHGKAIATTLSADLTPKGQGKDGNAFFQAVLDDPEARAALRDTLAKIEESVAKHRPLEITAKRVESES